MSDHRDAIRRRVASVMLEAVADTDFVLTGASALIEHGLINRPTDDVDLFSTRKDEGRVPEAVARMQAALEARGGDGRDHGRLPGILDGHCSLGGCRRRVRRRDRLARLRRDHARHRPRPRRPRLHRLQDSGALLPLRAPRLHGCRRDHPRWTVDARAGHADGGEQRPWIRPGPTSPSRAQT